mmetsp:Transcript_17932/g.17130  ORF Transcript_17932/g.17130 Transcript_17932/m.17130 type:complete len:132 (+) Transcript_17932:389-784(+)
MSFYRGGLEIKDSPYFQKIQEIVKEQKEKTLYSRTSKPFFSTLHRFSQEQFEFIAKEFEPWLTQFNYEVDLPQKKVILKEITENDFIYKHNLETMKKVKEELPPHLVCNPADLDPEGKAIQEDHDTVMLEM